MPRSPTAPPERHARSPKYTIRSGATPRTSGYTSCGFRTFVPSRDPSGPGAASSFATRSAPPAPSLPPATPSVPVDRRLLDGDHVRGLRLERQVALLDQPVVEAEAAHHRPRPAIPQHDRDGGLGGELG